MLYQREGSRERGFYTSYSGDAWRHYKEAQEGSIRV